MGTFEDYSAALSAFKNAHEALDNIASQLTTVANHLGSHRDSFTFSNTGVGFPPEVIMNPRSPSENADHWKSANQINEAIYLWHQSRNQLRNLLENMPEEQRSVLQSLPDSAQRRSIYR